MLASDGQIDLSGVEIRVPQQLLNRPDVGASFHQAGREVVAEAGRLKQLIRVMLSTWIMVTPVMGRWGSPLCRPMDLVSIFFIHKKSLVVGRTYGSDAG